MSLSVGPAAPRLDRMETFFVVVMALVMLAVGVLALLAVRRLSAQTDALTGTDERKDH